MTIKNIVDIKDRTVTIEPDGSLRTKEGLFVFKLTSAGYDDKYDERIPHENYILAPTEPTMEEIKNYLLNDSDLEGDVTDWDNATSYWDEFVEVEKVRLA